MSTEYNIEDVFKTEGVPEYTYVRPPNYNDILVDIRNTGKPVIIEGQSGTGKTTTIKRIIADNNLNEYEYLSARKPKDADRISLIANGSIHGRFIIDDFHRLDNAQQERIGNIIKSAAEDFDHAVHPKLIIIGINKVGQTLIMLVHDIAKRCGIHRITPADPDRIAELITKGEEKLNIVVGNKNDVYTETKGDYWLTQLLCKVICLMSNVLSTQTFKMQLACNMAELRKSVSEKLAHNYSDPVKEFCRGKKFRSTNDPYYKLLKCVSLQETSIVDLMELANAYPDVKGSINNIKERRLKVLIESKPVCEKYFYYNYETKTFAIEDPALFYYLKILNWDALRRDCGFRDGNKTYDWELAISFAGNNRQVVDIVQSQLEEMDVSVFYDENYESNMLGKSLSKVFREVFVEKSRFVIAVLDKNHYERVWPTFERDCFVDRVEDEAVIPIYLDDTVFPGIPKDTFGIRFKASGKDSIRNDIFDQITYPLVSKLESL